MKNEDNTGYASTLTVAFSNNPFHQAQYRIGPFETPQQLQYNCKLLLNFMYQLYPASTSLVKMIQEIDAQDNDADAIAYDISQNILYLIPWISSATGQPIKQTALQKQSTHIIARITNDNQLVFFMRQEIDQYNKLETGLICPVGSEIYARHGFVKMLQSVNSTCNDVNLVISDPTIGMVYINELLCPKDLADQTYDLNYNEVIDSDYEWEKVLPKIDIADINTSPTTPLIFSSTHNYSAETSAFKRPTSALRQ